jgi:hypothetical protein
MKLKMIVTLAIAGLAFAGCNSYRKVNGSGDSKTTGSAGLTGTTNSRQDTMNNRPADTAMRQNRDTTIKKNPDTLPGKTVPPVNKPE